MDINDRGNIKWTSLMLVEHRKKLEELKESENEKTRPDLDEQIYEIFDYKIKEALHKNIRVKITYFEDREYRVVKAHLKNYDTYQKKLILENSNPHTVFFKDIIDISLLS